ncbi:hypothetical protein [Polyangium sp. y55x31]|uniref:hypothetical protein n=1 Tax=Polyangium sp. y55x31 TaxID=3042688 RepID=UPI0024822AE6|nr:hypothetical protein [Polyangium sp. y55x31]MDI1476412.1 hypothetical protein [Polyangium sp. y55x31]
MSQKSLIAQCRHKASALIEARRFADGLAVLEHALCRAPDDLNLLEYYVDAARKAAESASTEDEILERLAALEAFMRGRIALVPFEALDRVLAWVAEIGRAREQKSVASNVSPEASALPPEVAAVAEGRFDRAPPSDTRDLRARIAALESARVLPSSAAIVEDIETALESAQMALAWDEIAPTLSNELARLSSRPPVVRAYLLQSIENSLRPFASKSDRLGPERSEGVCVLLQSLREASEALATETREAEARARWKGFREKYAAPIDTIEKWAEPWGHYPDGACQKILEQIRQVAAALQPLIPALGDTAAARDANDLAQRLQQQASRAVTAQQNRFDQFALDCMRAGYDACASYIGIIDKEKDLGDAMITHFGPLDPRQLGPEAQRAFSEIFEVLFQRLDKVSAGSDAEKRGTKLYVLKRIMETKRRTVSEF